MDAEVFANKLLAKLLEAGFEQAAVTIGTDSLDELNINQNQASLFRSSEKRKFTLIGIYQQRLITETSSVIEQDAIDALIKQMFVDVQTAPPDPANAISSRQQLKVEKGPQKPSLAVLTDKTRELIQHRAQKVPCFNIKEGYVRFKHSVTEMLTSEGSHLHSSVGSYGVAIFGCAKQGEKNSSSTYNSGECDDLADKPAQERFGLSELMHEAQNQIITQPIGDKFVGEVILSPSAAADLLDWFLFQLSGHCLMTGDSVYKDSVGELIASPLLTISSYLEGAGVEPITHDGFPAADIELVSQGRLNYLLPDLYSSRKLGIEHLPSGDAWCIAPGETARSEMVGSVKRGAIVNRLSMGDPAKNGDFSGVIKNSFYIEDGQQKHALSETMISGNVGKMLKNIVAVSKEFRDTGSFSSPWLQISGLHFS
ncbi:metallopeptidase TldD-related protein [Corallincola platygyrae]|uniref:Metallopeptidase TldD-related protein n=1 Tax=Corallincola platygyrae TaxID=1193278 RepID=A0ABW4XJX5_9GAMM